MTKIKPSNIIQHELIGLRARIVSSKNKYLVGIEGVVIDETRNTLIIVHEGKPKVIPKAVCVFEFVLPNGLRVSVEGQLLIGAPEDRIKKVLKRRW